MPPASRLTDMHACPMLTVLVPHVGGPIIGPGAPTVLVANLPAAVVGDNCTCVGPPDSILMGSTKVMAGNKPMAHIGSTTSHGGTVVLGAPTVIVS